MYFLLPLATTAVMRMWSRNATFHFPVTDASCCTGVSVHRLLQSATSLDRLELLPIREAIHVADGYYITTVTHRLYQSIQIRLGHPSTLNTFSL